LLQNLIDERRFLMGDENKKQAGFNEEGEGLAVGVNVQGPNQVGMPESGARVGVDVDLSKQEDGNIYNLNGRIDFGKTDVTSDIDSGSKVTAGFAVGGGYSRALSNNIAVGAAAEVSVQSYDQQAYRQYWGDGINDPPAVGGPAEAEYNKGVDIDNAITSVENGKRTLMQGKLFAQLAATTNNQAVTAKAQIGPVFTSGFGENSKTTVKMAYNVGVKADVAKLGKNAKLYVKGNVGGDFKGNTTYSGGLGVQF
jgi:hypothetical protein